MQIAGSLKVQKMIINKIAYMFPSSFKFQTFIPAFVIIIFISCLAKTITVKQNGQEGADQKNIFLADPTVFYNKGTYYLYGTGAGQYADGFAAYTSANLKKWKGPVGVKGGYAFKKGDAYGDTKFWAPQVFKYNGKFYMAYAANEHIAIAVSNNPLGPFTQEASKSLSEEIKQIDPYIFIEDNGKKYLYYVVVANGGNRIFVAEMNDDMLSVKTETAKQCIEATDVWENTEGDKWSVTEGPTVIKHNDLYYLIYSANHFKHATYAVGYATSKSPYGPWKKYEGNPIIHKNITGQNGSGHGDLIKGNKNEWIYVFHTHNSAEKVPPRKTALIKIKFIKGKSGIDKLIAHPQSFNYLHQQ